MEIEMEKQISEPATQASDIKIPDQLRGLFCEPLLLEGEDPSLYWGLVEALIAERKPATTPDWIDVSDLVTKLWEERLLRRGSNGLVRGGMIEALQSVLFDLEQPRPEDEGRALTEPEYLARQQGKAKAAARKARDYYRENPKKRKELGAFLTECGMTEAELYAQAFKRNSEALQIFERMIATRERGRRKLRKEDERRRREDMKKAKTD